MNEKAADGLIDEIGANGCFQKSPSQFVPPILPRKCRTPKDYIRHTCAPPIVQPEKLLIDTIEAPSTSGSHDLFEVDFKRRDSHDSREPAGWLSSLALHAVLIAVLGLLLSPADFGGKGIQRLSLSFSNEDKLGQDVLFEIAASEDESIPDDAPALDESPDGALDGSDGSEEGGGDDASGGQAAPQGSFFGIEAEGHEFVYVLDMSGSMRGRRFERATAELVRSVCDLRESQNFYVLLFDDSAVQMFGESSYRPTPVSATSENKEKLSRWLKTAFSGGSTDPREALRVALRMKPSAIFMLSDGKFNGRKNQKRASLLRGNSDAFSIVAAASTKIPIHAIAFENNQSCENMQRLAEMTDGKYRFADSDDKTVAQASLSSAREAIQRGDKASADILLREMIASHGHTLAGWKARKELAAMLIESAEVAMNEGRIEIAIAALLRIVEMDLQAVVTAEFQHKFVAQLLRRSQQESAGKDETAIIAMLAEVADRFPNSKATQQIMGPLANGLLDEARELGANNEPVQSLMKMEEVLSKYPRTLAAEKCRMERQRIIDDLLSRAQELRWNYDDAVSARYLRKLVATFKGTRLETLATRALEELATEMLTKVRDASIRRDRITKDDTNRQLTEGFAGDEILQRMRRDFSRKELNARDLLRRGSQLEKVGEVDGALRRYNDIVKNYSGAIAAKKAQDRLRVLKRERAVSNDNAMLLETMKYEDEAGR